MRASDVFRVPSVWAPPLVIVVVLVFLMTLFYFGSVVNPIAHLHGLPVAIVNEDVGADTDAGRVNLGADVGAGLRGSPAVSDRLSVRPTSLRETKDRMDVDKEYAAVVIPPGFTRTVLALGGASQRPESTTRPTIQLLTNPRAGNLAVSLATGVLQPALAEASRAIGRRVSQVSTTPGQGTAAALTDPVTVEVVPYRPLPAHTALGLSPFYISLLIVFCGFLGAVVVTTSVDAVLGYAVTEIGPVWRQRQPVAISRWQTLLAKWAMVVPFTLILTSVMLATAVWVLDMDAPHFWLLWLLAWFAGTVVALGTLVLFAALGTLGQLVALLVFVYLALASSGGTVPLQALSGFFRFVANFEPLRQILDGVRAILYFDASGEAGLTRAFVATSLGLAFWVALGVLVTMWYDRKKLHRMPPELLEYVDQAVRGYTDRTRSTTKAVPAGGPPRANADDDAR